MYGLNFDKKAIEYLSKLDNTIKKRIWDKLQSLKEDPFRFLEHLESINGFKLRVGDYRLIIDVDENKKILNISKIGHRKNIYER